MTQYMLIEADDHVDPSTGLRMETLDIYGDFLVSIARGYFEDPTRARLVVDPAGLTEPLVDDVWEAKHSGQDVAETRLVKLMDQLVSAGMSFVCWCGSDSKDLPKVCTWTDLMNELLTQVEDQPADFYVHYCPSTGRSSEVEVAGV